MYTLPLATVGTVNFTALPAVSRPGFCALFHNSLPMFLASYARRTAGPPAVKDPFPNGAGAVVLFVPRLLESIAQRMPFVAVGVAEIDGDAPGNPNVDVVCVVGVVAKSPVVGLNANAWPACWSPNCAPKKYN